MRTIFKYSLLVIQLRLKLAPSHSYNLGDQQHTGASRRCALQRISDQHGDALIMTSLRTKPDKPEQFKALATSRHILNDQLRR